MAVWNMDWTGVSRLCGALRRALAMGLSVLATMFVWLTLAQGASAQSSISITSPSDGDVIVRQVHQTFEISGTSVNVPSTHYVSVRFNGVTYNGVSVNADGTWSLILPGSVLIGVTGTQAIEATASDANMVQVSDAIAVTVQPAAVRITSPAEGSILGKQANLAITGGSEGVPSGTIVVLIMNGKVYVAATQSDGSWQAQIPAADMNIADGNNTLDARVTTADGTFYSSVNVTVTDTPIAKDVSVVIGAASGVNSIPIQNVGQSATAVELVDAPNDGTVSIAGLSLTYTPNPAFVGPDTFTYRYTGPNGTSNTATVNISVAQAPAQTPPVVTAPASGGQVGPITGLSGTASPNHTIIIRDGNDAELGQTLAGTDGRWDFGFATPYSVGTHTFRIVSHKLPAVALSAPRVVTYEVVAQSTGGATDKLVTIAAGATPAPVDLTAGASGPFTEATIGAVSPPEAGTARLEAAGGVYHLHFSPNPYFAGTSTVPFTLTRATGMSSANVVFTHVLDETFVSQKVEQRVGDFVTTRSASLAANINRPSLTNRLGSGPGRVNITPNGNSVALNFASSTGQISAWNAAGSAADALAMGAVDTRFNAWIDGSMTLHLRNSGTDKSWGRFAMVSVGGDYLVDDNLLLGVALHGDVMVEEDDFSEIDGTGFMIGPYVSMQVSEGLFVDAEIYYGRSWNDLTAGLCKGTFETERLLGQVGLEGELALTESLMLRPQASVFYLREEAGAYAIADGLGATIAMVGMTTEQIRLAAGAGWNRP